MRSFTKLVLIICLLMIMNISNVFAAEPINVKDFSIGGIGVHSSREYLESVYGTPKSIVKKYSNMLDDLITEYEYSPYLTVNFIGINNPEVFLLKLQDTLAFQLLVTLELALQEMM